MEERRKFVRVQGVREVRYKTKGTVLMRPAAVKDISLIGINFYVDEKLDSGTRVELHLDLPGESRPIMLEGEVIWQISSHNNRFATGVRFQRPEENAKARLFRFIADCAKRVEEHREFVRCALDVELTYVVLGAPEKKYSARTVDISQAGMKITLRSPLENSARLKVSFMFEHDIDVIELEGKVVWVRPEGQGDAVAAGIIFTTVSEYNKGKIDRFIARSCRTKKRGGSL